MNFIFILVLFFLGSTESFAKIKIAITVDDLPSSGALPQNMSREHIAEKMTKILMLHQVPEVYGFINAGKIVQQNESLEVLKIWRKARFPLGNHTFLHQDINNTSVEDFYRAIKNNEPMLKKLSGDTDWKFFRYPYLHEGPTLKIRNSIRRQLFELGYKIAQVTIDFEDWSWNNAYARCRDKNDSVTIKWLKDTYIKNALDILDRAESISRALFGRSVSHILLLHIGGFGAEMLDQMLTEYKRKGAVFIPLSEAIKDDIYTIGPEFVSNKGSDFLHQVMISRKLSLEDIGLKIYDGHPGTKLDQVCL